ncbi:hypothetical protein HPB47_023153, partial [Ixodes persulcatus]
MEADQYFNIVSGGVRKPQGLMVTVNTDWTLQDPIPQLASVVSCTFCGRLAYQRHRTAVKPRSSWELERLEISANDCVHRQEEEKNNEAIARQCLDKLMWRQGSNNERPAQYNIAIRNYLKESFARRAPQAEVLGVHWDREKDFLGTKLELLTINRNTKRFILQASARIFDPLGLLIPATITANM